jgi:fumarylacetoacetase
VVRIGDHAVPAADLARAGLTEEPERTEALNVQQVRRLRAATKEYLREPRKLVPISSLDLVTPMPVSAFVDFYSGIQHASNVGRMFRPDMPPLLPNYRHLPIAYNGRSNSVVPSGTTIRRPHGITRPNQDEQPIFGPTKELDFELEVGFYVGQGSMLGETIDIKSSEEHIAGVVLVNDWSARDVQRFEYQPLGPFLAKTFATSVSPWMVALDALEPYRVAGPTQEPEPLEHLQNPGAAHFDIQLEVALVIDGTEHTLSRTTTRELYWSFAQQLTHQSSNGTPIERGDLYASGTISGAEPGTFGSLLELTWRGTQPLRLGSSTRTFLENGDEVILRGFASGPESMISMGEVRGRIAPG